MSAPAILYNIGPGVEILDIVFFMLLVTIFFVTRSEPSDPGEVNDTPAMWMLGIFLALALIVALMGGTAKPPGC